jgi:hypothetical protein
MIELLIIYLASIVGAYLTIRKTFGPGGEWEGLSLDLDLSLHGLGIINFSNMLALGVISLILVHFFGVLLLVAREAEGKWPF